MLTGISPPALLQAEGFVWRSEDVRRQVEENKRMGAAAVNVTVEKVRIKHQLEAVGDNDPEAKARWGPACCRVMLAM